MNSSTSALFGITEIRRVRLDASRTAAFAEVEDESRWDDGFGIQCEG